MSVPEVERKKMCTSKGLLTESQYKTAMTFANSLPALKIESAFFKVMGEKFITPSSLVQFVLKMRVVPPGSNPPPVNPKDLLDEDPDETDVDALLGRKSRWSDSTKEGDDGVDLPLSHAPFYPRDHHPAWYITLVDLRLGKLVVPPQAITSFDKSPEGFAVVTAKMQFQAPPQAGEYGFTMVCLSDSYIGLDIQQTVTLVVSDPSKVSRIEEVDDISEPEEGMSPHLTSSLAPANTTTDSLAGQMSAMRGSGAPVKKSKKKGAAETSDDDEDESDTEGEQEGVSDTDTDTDSEDES